MRLPFHIVLASPEDVDEVVRIDDDAATLYGEAGMPMELAAIHPFVLAELARWTAAARDARLFVARDAGEHGLGFAAVELVDGAAYLDQLSVRRDAMRRGIGRALLDAAIQWAVDHRHAELWLTTYAHLAFNRPYYERLGFEVAPESALGPEIRQRLAEQRATLPAPEERIAMRRALR